ncbi:hypothetical protein ACQJBY_060265 [Aegilops geniculata]
MGWGIRKVHDFYADKASFPNRLRRGGTQWVYELINAGAKELAQVEPKYSKYAILPDNQDSVFSISSSSDHLLSLLYSGSHVPELFTISRYFQHFVNRNRVPACYAPCTSKTSSC